MIDNTGDWQRCYSQQEWVVNEALRTISDAKGVLWSGDIVDLKGKQTHVVWMLKNPVSDWILCNL